jgi:subtilase family serine protease
MLTVVAAASAILAGCQSGHPAATTTATTSAQGTFDCPYLSGAQTTAPLHLCYSPQQFRIAYGIQPLVARGVDGRGQTVVLPELYPKPGTVATSNVRQDLAFFDRRFGLPDVRLQVITRLADGALPYRASNEEAGDAEMVHAIAPDATIRVVLLPSYSGNLYATVTTEAEALRLAPLLGGVVSISAGLGEHCYTPAEVAVLNAALQVDQDQHVTVIAASGDNGAASAQCPGSAPTSAPVKGVNFPASDPLVLAVGGTQLHASHTTGVYLGETAWNDPIPAPVPPGLGLLPVASNGGFSTLFPRPAYQAGIPGTTTSRGVPDVAASASMNSGMAGALVVDGRQTLGVADGTSAAAPFWAGIIALADQYAGHHLGFVNPAIYRIGRNPKYKKAFHDITSGDNTVRYPQGTVAGYRAIPGWDPVTGWGSPNAQVLVPLLRSLSDTSRAGYGPSRRTTAAASVAYP